MINIDNMFGKKIKKNNFNNFKSFNLPKFDMFSKDKFTPAQYGETEVSAARRFGGRNLQGLRRIGAGRDREVFALDDDKVIKVAKNPGGLVQNISEKDIERLGMGKVIEEGKDYVVMKRQQPLSEEGKKKLSKIRKVIRESPTENIGYNYGASVYDNIRTSKQLLSADDSPIHEAGITTEILDYPGHPKEIFATRQWAEDEEGNLVLVDGGALLEDRDLQTYRVKDFTRQRETPIKQEDGTYKYEQRYPWQYTDWQDTQMERRQYRDVGTYDREKKFERGYSEEPEILATLPMDDEVSKDAWRKIKRTDYVIEMTPDEYLRATGIDEPEKYKPETYHDYESNDEEPIYKLSDKIVGSDVEVELPYVDSETIYLNFPDHEGRHRAYAAKLAGEEKIPVIVPPPDTWRTEEIKDEFVKRAFPRDVGTEYEDQWKSSIDSRFPFQHATLDMRGRKIYREILEEKDLIPKEDTENKDIYMYNNKIIREDR